VEVSKVVVADKDERRVATKKRLFFQQRRLEVVRAHAFILRLKLPTLK
jgi:hypothetical protein